MSVNLTWKEHIMMSSYKTMATLVATVLVGFGGPATAQTQPSPSSKPTTQWVDWTAATNATATGTLGGLIVKYTGQINPAAQTSGGFNFWVPATPFLSSQVSNAPPDPDIIRSIGGSGAGTYTVTFSQPVKNPVMAIFSLGRREQSQTYEFIDAPFDVLSSSMGSPGGDANSLVKLPGNVLKGVEGHGLIQFTGTFTSIRWTVPTAEYWSGFTFGIPLKQNQPPVANAGADQTVECVAGGAKVKLDGSRSSDPDGDTLTYSWTGPFGTASGVSPTVTLSPGLHTVTLTVNDGKGGTASDSANIKIADTTAPQITSASASPATLWPPNHKMVSVSLKAAATDSCDATPTCLVSSVSSNEPLNGPGDGNTSQDWDLTGDLTVALRSERSGTGTDRVYTLTAVCGDDSGNSTTKTVEVTVPHDQRSK